MKKKFVYERLSKALPQAQIRHAVGNMHVIEPLDKVGAAIKQKCVRAGADDRLARACERFAKVVHLKNRETYIAVTRGLLYEMTPKQKQALRRMAKGMG